MTSTANRNDKTNVGISACEMKERVVVVKAFEHSDTADPDLHGTALPEVSTLYLLF